MIDRVVTITGPPGSGKSTAGRRVAEALGLEYLSAGELFRAEGTRRGMDVEAFSQYAEAHDEVDRSVDAEMLRCAGPGRLLDGRLVGAFARRHQVPCHYLEVTCEPDERYRRLAGRDHLPLDEATRRTRLREASERRRYLHLYAIDLEQERPDLAVDSTHLTAEEVAARLLAYLKPRPGSASP